MKYMLKIIVWAVASLVGLAVAGVLTLVIFINPNDYRDDIQAIVADKTGMVLVINGDLGWQFWPWLGFSINDAALKTNANTETLVSFKHAGVKLDVLALFSQEIHFNGIHLNQAIIKLVKHADGTTNWDISLPNEATTTNTPPDSAEANTTPAPESTSTTPTVEIKIISVTNSTLRYVDHSTHESVSISDFEFLISNFAFDKPYALQTAFTAKYLKHEQAIADIDFNLNTRISINKALSRIEAQSFEVTLNSRTLPSLSQPIELTLSSAFEIDLASSNFALKTFELNTSAIDYTPWKIHPVSLSFKGAVNFEHVGLLLTDLSLTSKLSNTHTNIASLPLSLHTSSIQYDQSRASGSLSKLQLMFDQTILTAGVTYDNSKEDHAYIAALQSNTFNLKTLLSKLGIALHTTHADAFTQFSFSSKLQGNADSVDVPSLILNLDQSTLKGSVTQRFAPAGTRFTLHLDKIDVDNYLPPASDSTPNISKAPSNSGEVQRSPHTPSNSTVTNNAMPEALFPVDLIKSLDIVGTFDADNIIIRTHPIENFHTDISIQEGVAHIQKLDGKLYVGDFKTSTKLDVNPAVPTVQIDLDIENIPLAPILEKEAELTRVTGFLFTNGVYTMQGNSVDALKASLNGDGKIELVNGEVKGINADKLVCNAYRTLKKLNDDETQWNENTAFKELFAIIKARNGIISTAPLTIQTLGLSIDGEGELGLKRLNIDYKTNITVVGQTQNQQCQANNFIQDLPVIIACKGNLEQSMASFCRPDISAMGKVYLKQVKEKANLKLAAEQARLEQKAKAEQQRLEAKLKAEENEARAKAKAKEDELKQKAKAKQKEAEDKANSKLKAEEARAKEKALKKLDGYFDF